MEFQYAIITAYIQNICLLIELIDYHYLRFKISKIKFVVCFGGEFVKCTLNVHNKINSNNSESCIKMYIISS